MTSGTGAQSSGPPTLALMKERRFEPLGLASAALAWLAIGVVEVIGLSGRAGGPG